MDDKQVIFAATTGEYADYRVEGLFTRRPDAQALLDEISKAVGVCDSPDIEEWVLDERVGETVTPRFRAVFDVANDVVFRTESSSVVMSKDRAVAEVAYYDTKSYLHPLGTIQATSYASEEHAIELCRNKREELRAKGVITYNPREAEA